MTLKDDQFKLALEVLNPSQIPEEVHALLMGAVTRDYLENTRAMDVVELFQEDQRRALHHHRLWFVKKLRLIVRGGNLFFATRANSKILGRALRVDSDQFRAFIQFIEDNDITVTQLTLGFVLPSWGPYLNVLISHCTEIIYDYQMVLDNKYFSNTFEECASWYEKVSQIGLLSIDQALAVVSDARFKNVKRISIYNNVYKSSQCAQWLQILGSGVELCIKNTALYSKDIDPTFIPSLNAVLFKYPDFSSQVSFDVLMGSYNPNDDFNTVNVNPMLISTLELTNNMSLDLTKFANLKELRVPFEQDYINLIENSSLPASIETLLFKESKNQLTDNPVFCKPWVLPKTIKSLQFISLDLTQIQYLMNAIDFTASNLIDLRLLVNDRVLNNFHFNTLPSTLECVEITRIRNPNNSKILIKCDSLPANLIKKSIYKRSSAPIEIVDNFNNSVTVLNCVL